MTQRSRTSLSGFLFATALALGAATVAGDARAACGADGQAPCTTAAAAKSSSNPFCPAGTFHDPRNGGECWSCPSGYTRSAAAVTAGNACYIPAGEKLSGATRHNKTAFAWDCKGGTFWDGYEGGYCWSCPSGYNRTANHIKGGNACSAGVPEQRSVATYKAKWGCPSGTFFDPRNGGECWTCSAGYNRNLNPVANADACTAQAPCNSGLKLASGVCVTTDASGRPRTCGHLNQRPCTVVEFIPSCEKGLTEVGGNGRCITDNIAANIIGTLNAAIDPSRAARIKADAANAARQFDAFLVQLKSGMNRVASDAAASAALKRIETAIRTRRLDPQSQADMQLLGSKLGLLAGQAGSIVPANVAKSSFGVFVQVSSAAIVGVSEGYAMIMNTAPAAGTFQIGLIQALGGSLGPSVGASAQVGIFWQPGTIDDAPGASVGLGVEASAGVGGAVGVTWNVSEGMEKKPDAWTQAIPGFQVAFSPGAKLSAAASGGWTTLLQKWEVAAAPSPAPTPAPAPAPPPTAAPAPAAASIVADWGYLYGVQPNGDLWAYRLDAGGKFGYSGKIGHGWSALKIVTAGNTGELFAVAANGDLLYYKHDANLAWQVSGRKVGNGWAGMKWVFAGGNHGDQRVVFAVDGGGTLRDYRFGGGAMASISSSVIGTGWGGFTQVFAGGNGAVYAIDTGGRLLKYQYNLANTAQTPSPQVIGSGWNVYRRVFAGSNGAIFGVDAAGKLFYYRDRGAGGVAGPEPVGTGFSLANLTAMLRW